MIRRKAMTPRLAGLVLTLMATVVCMIALCPPAATARNLEIPVFSAPGLNPDQSPSTLPGGRPFELVNLFEINQTPTAEELSDGGDVGPAENLKDLSFQLPPGMLANVATFPRCTQEAFSSNACPTVSQVGVAKVGLTAGLGGEDVPVFNMAPPPGRAAQFAFRVMASRVHVNYRVRNGSDYGITATVSGLSEVAGLLTSEVRIWGVPGDPAHDALRFSGSGTPAPGPYPDPPPFHPLLSNPTSCNGPLITTMEATTWQQPGRTVAAAPFEAPATSSCNQLDFRPTLEVKPTTNLADSPTGLEVHIKVPQNQDPEGSASAHLRTARIVLPAGLDLNPSGVNGLGTCSPEQIGMVATSNERQLLRYDMPPVNFSGTFTVTFAGKTTAPISATATRAQVAAALETLPGLAGNVSVGGAQGGWIITFIGALAGTNVPLMTGAVFDNPGRLVTVTAEGGTFQLEFGGVSTPPLPYDAAPGEIEAALRAIPAINLGNLFPGNVFVEAAGTLEGIRNYRVVFVGDLAGTKQPLTASSALTGPEAGVTVAVQESPPPRLLSVAEFGGNAPGTPQFTSDPPTCPDASKIGTVRASAPAVLGHPIFGNVYLAGQGRNPFGSLLAIYVTAEDPDSGIVLKLPGKIEVDQGSGRLVATVAEAPQLPFEDLQIEFFKGTTSPLTTPIGCGTYGVEAALTPWSAPESAVQPANDSFAITKGAGAGACVSGQSTAPDQTRFEAGTIDPSAGIYSPLVLKLSRPDGSRRLSAIDTTLPEGLLARLAGTPYCSDGALSAAASHSGAQEQQAPRCPGASRIGSIEVAAGSGPSPYIFSGRAYLAGPYRGGQLSIATVVPVLAGPFDLGTVVLRSALSVDPQSTRVHVVSDPFPRAIQGIPLDLRTVTLTLDGSGFAKNPTSCNPLAITGVQSAHFQVGDCGKLSFAPKLGFVFKGDAKRGGHPTMKTTLALSGKGNDANVAAASITLPKTLRLDKSRVKGTCAPGLFAGGSCPTTSAYGTAKVVTPLLADPLVGSVYLVRPSAKELQLGIALHGQVDVRFTGKLETGKGGTVRANFEGTPDVPISQLVLEMPGAKKGLFKSASSLCAAGNNAVSVLDGQNNETRTVKSLPTGICKKGGRGSKGKKRAGR